MRGTWETVQLLITVRHVIGMRQTGSVFIYFLRISLKQCWNDTELTLVLLATNNDFSTIQATPEGENVNASIDGDSTDENMEECVGSSVNFDEDSQVELKQTWMFLHASLMLKIVNQGGSNFK